jgi:hypothetical protein
MGALGCGFLRGGLGREGGLGGGVSVELLKVIKDERRRHHRRKYEGSPILRLPVLLLHDLLKFTLLVSSIDFDFDSLHRENPQLQTSN